MRQILTFFRQLYLPDRFFLLFGAVVVCFVVGFWQPLLFPLAQLLFILAGALVVLDALRLFQPGLRIRIRRRLPRVLSLGDTTTVHLQLQNLSEQWLQLTIIDELPAQLQLRDFQLRLALPAGGREEVNYDIRPTRRGPHHFGLINVFAATRLGLVERRFQLGQAQELPVYPSIIQMRRYELRALDRVSTQVGIKRMRRIGHSYEFDQIKNYVRGDDYRSINWKATGRRGNLMVNQYADERAQQIYCIIDKSRGMRLPFADLSLMDYAINTSLALTNIALKKHDRAGLITFSDKLGAVLPADSRPIQLNKILQTLYKEVERPLEADFELLYYAGRKLINGRSLFLLFTNFESMYALDRALPMLRRVNARHLLVVVFFENTEVSDFVDQPAKTILDIYQQTVARKFLAEKSAMVHKLRQFGIQSVLTRPADLTVNTINKYLELKARGLI